MAAEDDPAPLNTSAAGQEPPFVGAAPRDPPAGGGDGTQDGTPTVPSTQPRRIQLRLPAAGGVVRINSSGGRININTSDSAGNANNDTVGQHLLMRGLERRERMARQEQAPGTAARGYARVNIAPQRVINVTAGGRHIPGMGSAGPVLPPLEPQPMPNQTSDANADGTSVNEGDENGKANEHANMKQYECAICYEYMDSPVGCGSCQARFCANCLRRVLRQGIAERNPESEDPPNSAKCPSCRGAFTAQSIVHDRELCRQIRECTDTVACPYRGCGAEMKIGLLKAHEAQCPYIRMRCRYAEWGCEWVGKKKDLADHDAHQCQFRGGLGQLVERFRQSDAQERHLLQQHHMQIGAQSQMLSLHSRQMMMMRGRNAGSVLDISQLAYEASLFPGRFSATRETWSSLINHQEAKCAVCNVLLLMPTLALVFNISFQGFKLLSSIRQLSSLSENDMWNVADSLILSLLVGLVGVLCITCFLLDSKGPMDWTIFNVRRIIPGQSILRDLAAISVAMVHFASMEFFGFHPGFMLWHFCAIVTVFFTSFVCAIVERNESSRSSTSILTAARGRPVVIFGLRYGLLAALCGWAPSINAILTLRILARNALLPARWTSAALREHSACFLSQFSLVALISVAGLSSAVAYANDLAALSWRPVIFHWMSATALLVYINLAVALLDMAGRRLGEKNFHAGTALFMQAHRAAGAVLPNTKPAPIGSAVLGICSFLFICIAFG